MGNPNIRLIRLAETPLFTGPLSSEVDLVRLHVDNIMSYHREDTRLYSVGVSLKMADAALVIIAQCVLFVTYYTTYLQLSS